MTQAHRSPEFMSLTSQRMTLSVPRYICPSTVKLPHAHPTFLPMLTWMLMGTRGVHSVPHCGCDPCERLWVFLNVISHLGKKHRGDRHVSISGSPQFPICSSLDLPEAPPCSLGTVGWLSVTSPLLLRWLYVVDHFRALGRSLCLWVFSHLCHI